MKENKLHSIKSISKFLGILFWVNLVSGIILLIINGFPKGSVEIASSLGSLLTLIMSFVLWKLADGAYSTLQYLMLHKEDKPAAERDAEEELLKNYSDHR